MGRRVLVLNQDFSAITVCSVPKAFLLVYLDKAELIAEDKAKLRTVTKAYPMPSIIRLHNYINIPYRNGVVLNRQNLFKRRRSQYAPKTAPLQTQLCYVFA